jgi:hypothetical protein
MAAGDFLLVDTFTELSTVETTLGINVGFHLYHIFYHLSPRSDPFDGSEIDDRDRIRSPFREEPAVNLVGPDIPGRLILTGDKVGFGMPELTSTTTANQF